MYMYTARSLSSMVQHVRPKPQSNLKNHRESADFAHIIKFSISGSWLACIRRDMDASRRLLSMRVE